MIANFELFLAQEETTKEQVFELIKNSDPETKESQLVNLVESFFKYLQSERPCSACRGSEHVRCFSCCNKRKRDGIKKSTLVGYASAFFIYMAYYGFTELETKSFKKQIELPKIMKEQVEVLTHEMVKQVIENTSHPLRKLLFSFLATAGTRIGETMALKKSDFVFVDKYGDRVDGRESKDFRKIMVKIRAEITKTREPRRTYVSDQIEKDLSKRLSKIADDDFVFFNGTDPLIGKELVIQQFSKLRQRLGEKNRVWLSKFQTGTHHLSVHSFRRFFINNANEIDRLGFGHKIAGHGLYMKKYDSLSIEKEIELYNLAEIYLSLDGKRFKKEHETQIIELKKELIAKNQQLEDIQCTLQLNQSNLDEKINQIKESFENKLAEQQMTLIDTFLKSKKRK